METDPRKMTNEELLAWAAFPEGSEQSQKAKAELASRQIKAQLEATAVQRMAAEAEVKAAEASIASATAAKIAADAGIRSAEAAQKNTRYMRWSVAVTAISAIAAAFSAYFTYLSTVHP
jgi:hypothetical protein